MMKKITAVFCALLMLFACTAAAGGKAQAEGDEFIFGTLAYASAVSGRSIGDSFYYSDEWLSGRPEDRNDQLALISAQLSAAAGSSETAALLDRLGFSGAEEKRFDSEDSRDCAYVTGTKSIPAASGNRTVRAVVFQGHSYGEKGWVQNVTVNPEEGLSEEHAAYAAAARIFLEDYARMPREENELLWICGLSRGGAVANVVSAYLLEQENAPDLICFTFEAPATTQREEAHAETYRSIYNYLSDDDPVTMIPMWGMARFGTEIRINTETPAALKAALEKMNPEAAEYMETGDISALNGDVRAFTVSLIEKLLLAVPERGGYSAVRTVARPEVGTAEYSFQDGLKALFRILYSENRPGSDSLQDLLDWIPDVAWAYLAETWVADNNPENREELLQEAVQKRWNAAGACLDLMPEAVREKVCREDFYAMLQLISPLLVDRSLMTDGWQLPEREDLGDTELINYSDLIAAGGNSSLLILSHQPDVILARMKLLAPAPEFPAYAINITSPAADDSTDAAPAEIQAQADTLLGTWMSVRKAAWISTEEEFLSGQRVHYLEAAIASVGHLVPDDFRFTVNGAEPVSQEIRYEDGAAVIDGIWAFRLGEPEPAAVHFDTAGHGEAPESYTVETGTMLRYAQTQPADPGTLQDSQGTWDFNGWTDENGTDWEELTAAGDITLYASWTRVIDDAVLTCDLPRKGDAAEDILPRVTLQDGMPLEVTEASLHNGDTWERIEGIIDADTCILKIVMKPEEGHRFLSETTEDGEPVYTGKITVNGQQPDDVYLCSNTDNGITEWALEAEYVFRPEDP